MQAIKKYCVEILRIQFDYKQGCVVLPVEQYASILDQHEVYVCTSMQEGGPIPAMDAMIRGAVVVSTPVGQLSELVSTGENGFLCRSENEFKDTLRMLSEHPEILHRVRLSSRRTIMSRRNRIEIQERVLRLLQHVEKP
jgi:glycosyltransferase involved in cell wall biosynthesis